MHASSKEKPKERKSFRDEVERLRDGQGKAMERMNGYQRELGRILRAFKDASGAVLDDKYLGDQHQDINEFIMQLLEYTHQQFRKHKIYSQLEHMYLRDCMEWNKYINSNNSPVVTSFDGFLRRTRSCPRGHTFSNFDIFRTLTLHFDVRL
jgi:ubiquitin C-terminal hydrolase